MTHRGLAAALLVLAADAAFAQDDGKRSFERLCSRCHGADGAGGELGPEIASRIPARTDDELRALVKDGLPTSGMPGFPLGEGELQPLVAFLRTLRPRWGERQRRGRVETDDGPVEGLILGESGSETQILTDDRRILLFRRSGSRFRRVTSQTDWTTYNGRPEGSRYSPLDQIHAGNVKVLAPRWILGLEGASRLQVTPIVVDGVMYVTAANQCWAVDAGSGRPLWHYRRSRTRGQAGDAGGGINRGVAVLGDRLFMVTDHAHLIALHRHTGALLWDTEMADWRQNYGATSAPLVAGGLVISGVSGGDEGVRGFLAAHDPATGREVWRFWTVPRRGEPGSETWQGKDIDHPCAAPWLTGTFDPAEGTLYWPTGNPCRDYNGDERKGDNLYSDSVVALEAATGRMKWFFQYTPHDLWDWDALQTPAVVDTTWEGRPRRLLLHANRNGFFYVLDRDDGRMLRALPFVQKLTWATGVAPNGRPLKVPGKEPTPEGTLVCPAVEGATNWFSTAFHPGTGLYYVQALEKCTIYRKADEEWTPGRSYFGGSTSNVPGEPGRKVLRALDVGSGKVAWEVPQVGPADSWGGVLATAGGVVFYGEDGGAFAAVDATTGAPLWRFATNQLWKASPMTYVFDGRQYVVVASGPNIIAFGLPDLP